MNGKDLYNNGVWSIQKLQVRIPERPFEVLINGKPMGTTKLLAFSWRVPKTYRYPQVFVLYASGPITVRAFFNGCKNVNHDNLGLWAFQQPLAFIEKGSKGSINYAVIVNNG